MLERTTRTRRLAGCALAALLLVAGVQPALAADPGDGAGVVGRVVAVRGAVTAAAPGEAPRALHCNDPILAGDKIVAPEGAQLGVMSGAVYTGVNESSRLVFNATPEGAPSLALAQGHLRVVDAAAGDPSRVAALSLAAGQASTDLEAMVVGEKKVGAIAMICTWSEDVSVARGKDPSLSVAQGDCAIAKSGEPVYTTPANHQKLALLDDEPCAPRVAAVATPRFTVLPVVGAGPPGPRRVIQPLGRNVPLACDSSSAACGLRDPGVTPVAVIIPPIVPVGPPPAGP